MCSRSGGQSIWSSHALCAFEVGGYCNETISTCECSNGYTHDLFFLRQRDCSMPMALMYIIFSIILIASFAFFIIGLMKINNAVGTAKSIIISSTIALFCFVAFAVTNFIINFVANAISVAILSITAFFFFLSMDLSVYSIASPLFKLAEKPDDSFIKFMKIFFLLFRIKHITNLIWLFVSYENSKLIINDKGWNDHAAAFLILLGSEAILMKILIVIIGKRMIKFIELLMKATPDNPNHQTTMLYLEKIKRFLHYVLHSIPGSIISLILPPSLYVYSGYCPFSYILVVLAGFLVPIGCFAMVIYATRVSAKSQTVSNAAIVATNKYNDADGNTQNGKGGDRGIVLSDKLDAISNNPTSYGNDSMMNPSDFD